MATDFKFPDVGEGIHEGTVVKWLVKEGDKVKADQALVEVETDKAVVELPSPVGGTVLRRNFKEGEVVKVGEVLVSIGEPGEKVKAPKAAPAKPAEKKPVVEKEPVVKPAPPGRVLAAPATRKLARELDVDIKKVTGTGPGGKITQADVRKASSKEAGAPPLAEVPEGEEERVALSGMRKIIADRMVYSKTHIPHACGMDYIDVTRLVEVREKEKRYFEPKGVKLTYLPFIVKACGIALRRYPQFNAHFDEEKNEIVFKRALNIGIAVDTPEGLMVPVIKDVERKSIIEIAEEIKRLAELARSRKIKLDDLKGGTFTITNVGSVGGMYSTPIINPPEIAVMGVHRIKDLPLVINGKIEARKVMGISLCFDHRAVDGAAATEFMNVIKRHLEDPDLLLVDMT
jgi:pyruvate dehydrogenase E2 component (dihydrolipoamide acetyltransferase)